MTNWEYEWVDFDNFEKYRDSMNNSINEFVKKYRNLNEEILIQSLKDYEYILTNYSYGGKEGYYYWLKSQINQSNSEIKSKFKDIQDFTMEQFNKINFYRKSIGKLNKDKVIEILKLKNETKYLHFINRIFENEKYILSDKEEKILSLMNEQAYSRWKNMLSELISSEIKIIDDKEYSFEELMSRTLSEDKEVRDSSAKEINKILSKYEKISEHEFNALLSHYETIDKIRGYEYPDHSRHIGDNIDKEFIDILTKTVSENFEISKRFYDLKSKVVKHKLNYYDRTFPVGKIDKNFDWESSKKIVKKVLKKLDKEFLDIFEKFEKNKFDVYPSKGKRGGAFCVHFTKNLPTYIMLNHTDTIRDVKTLAHEVGHGINNELSRKAQDEIYFGTLTSTAEVASTFFEDFVFRDLIQDVDKKTKFLLIMQKISDEISTIHRQIAGYNFEKDVHKAFRKNKHLSSKEIGEIFKKNMKAYCGDSVELEGFENWWIYWSHFRRRFYVYSYASGLLISKGMQKLVDKDKSNIEKVKKFLSSGTSKSPRKLFSEMNIDIYSEDFWKKGLNQINDLLNEAENLYEELYNE